MTAPQPAILVIVAVASGFFAWGRWRADLVAVVALLAAVLSGAVGADATFAGFADPVIVVIACVTVISAAIRNSGLFDGLVRAIDLLPRRPGLRGGVVGGLAAAASAFLTTRDASAIFLPAAQWTARQTHRAIGPLAASLACVSVLGGMATLIGTIPNVIVSGLRRAAVGEGFSLFAFAPVGVVVAACGLVVVAVAWSKGARTSGADAEGAASPGRALFTSEVLVPPESPLVGQSIRDVQTRIRAKIAVSAIIREDLRRLHPRPDWQIEADDILVLAGEPEALQRLMEQSGLQIAGRRLGDTNPEQIGVVEAVVAPGSELIGASQASSRLEERLGVSLLAIGRHDEQLLIRLRRTKFRAGDVLLLQGKLDTIGASVASLGCLPLAERRLRLGRRRQVIVPVAVLVGALALAVTGMAPLPVALLCGLVLLVLLRSTTLAELYATVPWPVIVQVGALLPLAVALRTTGAADLAVAWLTGGAPAAPGAAVTAAVLVAGLLAAAAVRSIPAVLFLTPFVLALEPAGAATDALLMAVAVGTSFDVRAPLGPSAGTPAPDRGEPRGSMWLGLALALVVALIGVPAILLFWPLHR